MSQILCQFCATENPESEELCQQCHEPLWLLSMQPQLTMDSVESKDISPLIPVIQHLQQQHDEHNEQVEHALHSYNVLLDMLQQQGIINTNEFKLRCENALDENKFWDDFYLLFSNWSDLLSTNPSFVIIASDFEHAMKNKSIIELQESFIHLKDLTEQEDITHLFGLMFSYCFPHIISKNTFSSCRIEFPDNPMVLACDLIDALKDNDYDTAMGLASFFAPLAKNPINGYY